MTGRLAGASGSLPDIAPLTSHAAAFDDGTVDAPMSGIPAFVRTEGVTRPSLLFSRLHMKKARTFPRVRRFERVSKFGHNLVPFVSPRLRPAARTLAITPTTEIPTGLIRIVDCSTKAWK